MKWGDGRGGAFPPALAATAALIAYGSLYPFEFFACHDPLGGFLELLGTWRSGASIGDILANIVLYLPLGFFAARCLTGGTAVARIGAGFTAGAFWSFLMEFLQKYDVGRFAAMSDVYSNTFGALAGAVAGVLWAAEIRLPVWNDLRRRPYVVMMLSSWLGYRLVPYVPVIDLHKYWQAVKPLFLGPAPPVTEVYRHAANWVGVGLLLDSALGSRRARRALPLLAAAVLSARVAIGEIELSRAEVVGAVAASAVWWVWLYGARRRVAVGACLLAVAVVAEGLQPYLFLAAPRDFNWVPFSSFIEGEILIAVPSVMEKFFLYGALVWTAARAGLGRTRATVLTAGLVFGVHYAQVLLPGRSAEITDTILTCLAGVLLSILETCPESVAPASDASAEPIPADTQGLV